MAHEIPLAWVGSPADKFSAKLVRSLYGEDKPVVCQIRAAHVFGNSESGNEIVIADREQLGQLIDALQGAYYGWPR